jgi:hypothetical protein
MTPLRNSRRLKRFALAFSALFALALAIAQPHRVHHFFADLDHAHQQDATGSHHHDHSKTPAKSPQTECRVEALSQHCSAVEVALAQIPIPTAIAQRYRFFLSARGYHFSSLPFLRRAPPPLFYC